MIEPAEEREAERRAAAVVNSERHDLLREALGRGATHVPRDSGEGESKPCRCPHGRPVRLIPADCRSVSMIFLISRVARSMTTTVPVPRARGVSGV